MEFALKYSRTGGQRDWGHRNGYTLIIVGAGDEYIGLISNSLYFLDYFKVSIIKS